MSAPVVAPPTPVGPPSTGPGALLRSEWLKFRTVRSSWITLLVAVALGVGLGALLSLAIGSNYKSDHTDVFDPTSVSFAALLFAQLAVAVLGALSITGEYSTGMIRTSLTAVPRRGRMLAAKAIVLAAVTFVVGLVIGFAAFLIGQAVLKGQHAPSATLGQPHVLRAVIGVGLYLALIALLGIAIGTMVRNSAGTIAIEVGILFVVPLVSAALPSSIQNGFSKFWPTEAGRQILAVHRDHHTLHAWVGFGWMALIVAVLLAGAAALIQVRDA